MVEPIVDRYAAALLDQTDRMVALLPGSDLGRQVPSCPDWDLRQLVKHVGRAHRFAADVVRRRVREFDEISSPATVPAPEKPSALVPWLADGARELIETVRTVGPEQPVWNYFGTDPRAGLWLRRMTHETAVHRADAALTLGAPFSLDAELAADAITEWLTILNSPGLVAYRPEQARQLRGEGQTLHLHATDSPGLGEAGEWLIRRGPHGMTWTHGHQKGDVAVRALAVDLLLVLLGRVRIDDERIELIGDSALFEHWVRNATF